MTMSAIVTVDENQKFTYASSLPFPSFLFSLLTPTHLSLSRTSLNAHLKEWSLYESGFSYNLVAVFGSQSTGKSTLLNRLFGTKFDVMDESERRQTTKGIWMSKGKDIPVLVMDVEGTDGRERGEDQVSWKLLTRSKPLFKTKCSSSLGL